MYTEKELLKLAGKLANACGSVLVASPLDLSNGLEYMSQCLDEYNNAIEQNLKESGR
jgi:hypothetical protein